MKKSKKLFADASACIPGGVNSPVRSCKSVDSTPLFIQSAQGAFITDVDGHDYIDYVGSWGPMILGHAHPQVVQAVKDAATHGLSFGAPTEAETRLVKLIQSFIPSMQQIRLVNSGTEATMSAIRLARAYSQRDHIIKFAGCYHGHADSLLVQAGSGALTHGVPSSPGIPESTAQTTLVADFNHIDSVKAHFKNHSIAAVIIEPIAGNMNLIKATPEFLHQLHDLCQEHQTLLIFDEVMTGFRVDAGGAQNLYDITPDLTTLGKIIGGGMPIGALGGRKEIMQHLAPQGPVYQAGTLSGNPIATAAGIATLSLLKNPKLYQQITQATQQLVQGINQCAQQYQIPCHADSVGAMFGLYCLPRQPISDYQTILKTNKALFTQCFKSMLEHGVYLAPSPFEAGFVSVAHTAEIIDKTLKAFAKTCHKLSKTTITT